MKNILCILLITLCSNAFGQPESIVIQDNLHLDVGKSSDLNIIFIHGNYVNLYVSDITGNFQTDVGIITIFQGENKLPIKPIKHTGTTSEIGSITLKTEEGATDNLGATSTSAIVNVSVIIPVSPTVSAGEDQVLTLPDNSVTLTPSVVSTTPVEYSWTQVEGPTVSISGPTSEQLSLTGLTEGIYVFKLSVTDGHGLTGADEIRITVIAPSETTAASIPRFFSPNNDGTGDFWEWQNAEAFENSRLTIFNRGGQKIFETLSYNNTWDGKLDGQPLQDGDYYYVIQLANLTDIKGAVRIIR